MNGRRLYEEIGYVDEKYLQEAAAYAVRRRNSAWRVMLIAASIMLACTLLLGTIAANFALDALRDWIVSQGQEPDASSTPMEQMERAMDKAKRKQKACSADELMLFDRAPMLIFCEVGSDAYYTVSLSNEQLSRLVMRMQDNRRPYDAQTSVAPTYQIWLSFGDGVVVSPYLKNTAGNVGHGEVFDYDPELELGNALAQALLDCIQS